MSKELKPCPFCGSVPDIIKVTPTEEELQSCFPTGMFEVCLATIGAVGSGKHADWYSIACTNLDCGMRPRTFPAIGSNVKHFYTNWNTRTQQAAGEL